MADNIFFTADNHFDHGCKGFRTGILKHTQRPWDTVEEMNEALVASWNAKVPKKGSLVYIVGDFAWKNHNHWIYRVNGKKILILGSHDHMSQDVLKNFTEVHTVRAISVDGMRIFLTHCAPRVWEKSHYGVPCFFGHSHGRLKTYNLSRDVGIDTTTDYAPYRWSELKQWMAERSEEMKLSGRILYEHGKELWRQDDVAWAMKQQEPVGDTDEPKLHE